ncbi:adenylate/guanylate cyclase domain-containing protein [bacterium]|nr:adenylate/guanylate cyclase domain-containing protein [bacterium]
MKKMLKRYDILFTILLFLIIIPAEHYEWFSVLENQTLSLRHVLRNTYGDEEKIRFPHEKIALVVQDEAFFEEYGSFPLRRTDLGIIASRLRQLGAEIVVIDMLMDFASSYDEDPIIANHIKEAGNVIVVSQLVFEGKNAEVFDRIAYPTEIIREVAATAYSNHKEVGGMQNRLRIYPEIGKEYNEWPVSVKAVADYLGETPQVIDNYLIIGKIRVKLDQNNDFINDYSPLNNVSYLSRDPNVGISAMDILDMDMEDEDEFYEFSSLVKGKIVFVGETAEVGHDKFDSVVGEVWGVESLAYEVATLLKGAPLRSASTSVEFALVLIMLVGLIYIHSLSEPKLRFLFSFVLVASYISFCFIMYIFLDLAFSMSYTMTAGVIGFLTINVYLFIEERKEKRFIKEAFGQYLSPKVIDKLVEDPSMLSLGGERREMTAFFSDVQGFSTISESLTPDELVQLLNEYLTEMCNIIAEHDGTIDKFEGDAIIAFWGAPLKQDNHATLACLACIDMQKRLTQLREKWAQDGRPQLLARLGVNSGPMVVGNMGSLSRMDYTIMGDSVNLAARLEGANKFYKNFTMISEFTYKQAKDAVEVRELDTIRVVGKSEPITVYELLDRKNMVTGDKAKLIETFHKGLELYKQRDFKGALEVFESGLELSPFDGPTLTYIDRCNEFIKNPPTEDWDGVFTHTKKG